MGCGAAIGGYNKVMGLEGEELAQLAAVGELLKEHGKCFGYLDMKKFQAYQSVLDKLCHGDNVQMEYIISYLASCREELEKSEGDVMATLALLMFEHMKEMLIDIINMDDPAFGSENTKLVLLGGIQVNMPEPFQEFFIPLHFDIRSKDGTIANLLPKLLANDLDEEDDMLEEDEEEVVEMSE